MTSLSTLIIGVAAIGVGATPPTLTGKMHVADGRVTLQMTYINATSGAHCILVDDFAGHPMRHALRVFDDLDQPVPYAGMLANHSGNQSVSAFYIIPPGTSIDTEFDIGENYGVHAGRRYAIRYSLPITKCRAINRGLVEIPGAYLPFMVNPAFSFENWPDRLQTVSDSFKAWSRVGYYVELQPVTFELEAKD